MSKKTVEVQRQVVKFEPFMDAHGRKWEWYPGADYAGNVCVQCVTVAPVMQFYFPTALQAELFADLILASTKQEPL